MRHPLVEFVKFLAAIVLLCLTRNPYVSVLFLILEFVIAPSVKSVLALLGMTALSVIVNALVNHQGETYLFYLNDNIVTMESLAYGVFAGVQLWLLVPLDLPYGARNDIRENGNRVQILVSAGGNRAVHGDSFRESLHG